MVPKYFKLTHAFDVNSNHMPIYPDASVNILKKYLFFFLSEKQILPILYITQFEMKWNVLITSRHWCHWKAVCNSSNKIVQLSHISCINLMSLSSSRICYLIARDHFIWNKIVYLSKSISSKMFSYIFIILILHSFNFIAWNVQCDSLSSALDQSSLIPDSILDPGLRKMCCMSTVICNKFILFSPNLRSNNHLLSWFRTSSSYTKDTLWRYMWLKLKTDID